MRLKISALLTGLIIILLCMSGGFKINPLEPAALLQTSTPALAGAGWVRKRHPTGDTDDYANARSN